MSIKSASETKRVKEQEFYEIDYQVTGLAYAIHNEIGRLGDCGMRRFIKTSWLIDVAQLGLENVTQSSRLSANETFALHKNYSVGSQVK